MPRFRVYGILAALLAVAPSAHARHLVSLIDAPKERITITKDFVGTGPTTLIIFGGYQIPSFWQAEDITVTGPYSAINLLHPEWTYTPAPIDPMADQASSPGNEGLEFGGTSVGSYDLFSQDFSTIAGTTYQLSFLYIQDYPGSNGMKVTVDETLAQVEAESATPEPSTWAMMLAGFGMIGLALRHRHQARTSSAIS